VVNRLFGWAGSLVTSIAVAMSLFHLYAAVAGAWPFTDFPIIATQPLRYAHVAFVLMLSFLLFPLSARFRDRIRWWDIAAGIMGAAILVYAIEGGEEFTDRATMPTHLDVVLGSSSSSCCSRRRGEPPGGSFHSLHCRSWPMPWPVPICRRRGRTAATTFRNSSATCSSRSKGFSAFPSTCPPR